VDETGTPYAFTGGDPVNQRDPLGLLEVEDEGGANEYDGPLPGEEGEGAGGGGGGSGDNLWTNVENEIWVNNVTGEISDVDPESPSSVRTIDRIESEVTAHGRGNFSVGSTFCDEANDAGEEWVGEGATLSSDGVALTSADGLRQYRFPTFKQNWGQIQANFESRATASGKFTTNGHLSILLGPQAP
jgi:hypothetical protein